MKAAHILLSCMTALALAVAQPRSEQSLDTVTSKEFLYQLIQDGVYFFIAPKVTESVLTLANAAGPQAGREASAQQKVTVADVQRILAEDEHKRDARVAQQLSVLELTERMSDARLRSLEQSVPGQKSRSALVALADASVFLDPAAVDVPSQVPPESNEQRRMIVLTVQYLARTLPKLPDLYATRTTVRYDGGVRRATRAGTSAADLSWRKVGGSKVVVVYRDGKEVIDPREWGNHGPHPEEGLITKGTFGPILSTVILDAAHGEMIWSRWERGSTGTLAVFRYRVPQNESHYSVAFHGLSSDAGSAARVTGYHGEVATDPAIGTILRLTVQADQPFGSPIHRGDIMVEYGPVEIGGKTYTCPVRSVSISEETGSIEPFDQSGRIPETNLLNDVTFDNYHQFRADVRILPANISATRY